MALDPREQWLKENSEISMDLENREDFEPELSITTEIKRDRKEKVWIR